MGTPISSQKASVAMPEIEDDMVIFKSCKSEQAGRKVTFKAKQKSEVDLSANMFEIAPEALIDEANKAEERGDLVEAKRLHRLAKAQKEADTEVFKEFKKQSDSNDEESNADENIGTDASLAPGACDKIINIFNANEKPVGSFQDIVGYDSIKAILSASFLVPPNLPGFFKVRKPLASVLLVGPLGAGKKLLAKSLAAERGAKLIALPTLRLYQSDFGNMNRLVSQLFAYAKVNLPVVVFLEDIDGILPNEFMGLATLLRGHVIKIEKEKPAEFILIAGTCSPTGFNSTTLFDKVIKIEPLTCDERVHIIKFFLRKAYTDLSPNDFMLIGAETKCFTAGALRALCRESELLQVHTLYAATHFKRTLVANKSPKNGCRFYWTPCKESDPGAIEMKYSDVKDKNELLINSLKLELLRECLSTFDLSRVGAEAVYGTATDENTTPAVANVNLDEQEKTETARSWYHVIADCFFRA